VSASTPEQLFELHVDLALKIARSLPIIGHTVDEKEQEARIALWKAANAFDPNRGDFEPFASMVIRNHLRNFLQRAQRRAHFEITTLDVPAVNQGEEDGENLKDVSILSPEVSPLVEAERNDIRAVLRDEVVSLTPAQQEVLHSYAEGSSYAEIARQKRVSKAAVRQMLQRAAEQARPVIQSRGVLNAHFMPTSREETPRPFFDFPSPSPPPRSGSGVILTILVVFVLWLIYMALPILKEIFMP
jgi:RNA polymerase sigma factor (sigma-70 family)